MADENNEKSVKSAPSPAYMIEDEGWFSEYAEVIGVDDGTFELLPEAYASVIEDEPQTSNNTSGTSGTSDGSGGGGGDRNNNGGDAELKLKVSQLFEKMFSCLENAKTAEDKANISEAAKYYHVALEVVDETIRLQHQIIDCDPRTIDLLKSKKVEFSEKRMLLLAKIEAKAEEEEERAAIALSLTMNQQADAVGASTSSTVSFGSKDQNEVLARASLAEALQLDEKGRSEDALPLYIQSAEQYLAALANVSKMGNKQYSDREKSLRVSAAQVLDRIEVIKKLISCENAFSELDVSPQTSQASNNSGSSENAPNNAAVNAMESLLPAPAPACSDAASSTPPLNSTNQLTPMELDVLRRTSKIHGRLFLPWVSDHKSERFRYTSPWEDPEGLLPLSAKQKSNLGGWRRPKDFVKGGEPIMISQVSPLVITQDLVCDCSFVASLCITAAFERRFRKRLITGIIYPQNSSGTPVVNPSGKYLVKLWANGCERRVVVDDRLPCDQNGNLMTCYSNNKRELWVSIIEKAYMKLNGGYDFPGSNSGIDLYALTGWLPEVISLKNDLVLSESNKVWGRLESAHRFGDCLITIATGVMDEAEADRSGLVPTHAYAVLDVREISAATAGTSTNLRLVLVKNPWARRRWRGNYSATDQRHWTPKLKSVLNFDSDLAQASDNGIFWIDWLSLQKYFRSIHLNWNPGLFRYRTTIHHHWAKDQGPGVDSFNYGPNPQFTLTVGPAVGSSGATVWVLLSRHIVRKEHEVNTDAHDARGGGKGNGLRGGVDDSDDSDYIACHVYDNTGGRRVFTPKKPFIQGVYHSDPHILVKLDVPNHFSSQSQANSTVYTLVISQLKKTRGIDFTIHALCTTSSIRLSPTPQPPKHVLETRGVWNASNSGGPVGNVRFYTNPQYSVAVKTRSRLHVELLAPKEIYVGIRLVKNTNGKRIDTINKPSHNENNGACLEECSSGAYSSGFCYLESAVIEPGLYTLVATTYEPNQHGSFFLKVFTSAPLQHLKAIPPEGDGMKMHKVDSSFSLTNGMGCGNYGNYHKNPLFQLVLKSRSCVIGRLFMPETCSQAVNLACFPFSAGSEHGLSRRASPSSLSSSDPNNASCLASSHRGVYTSSSGGISIGPINLEPGSYLLLPSTFEPWVGNFRLVVYTTCSQASINQVQ